MYSASPPGREAQEHTKSSNQECGEKIFRHESMKSGVRHLFSTSHFYFTFAINIAKIRGKQLLNKERAGLIMWQKSKSYKCFLIVMTILILEISTSMTAALSDPNKQPAVNLAALNSNKDSDLLKSGGMLKELCNKLLCYANDHKEMYPKNLGQLADYDVSEANIKWYKENIVYLGAGKGMTALPDDVIAYDKTLLKQYGLTMVLKADSEVVPRKAGDIPADPNNAGASQDDAASAKSVYGENEAAVTYIIRVVDGNGQPVAGVSVYKSFSTHDEAKPRREFLSDANGIIATDKKKVFKYENKGVLLYALSDDGLVGFLEIRPEGYGKQFELKLQPGCAVRGKLESSALKDLGQSLEWKNVYLYRDKYRPLSYSSKMGKFAFLLPPGRYKLIASGTSTYSSDRDIEIKVDQKELEANFDLSADKLATLVGKPAPEFSRIKGWFNSKPLNLTELRGKVVLLDFWGYWCGPCVAGMPDLVQLHERFIKNGLVIIAVHDGSLGSVEELQKKLKELSYRSWDNKELPFAIALDGGGSTKIDGTDAEIRGATTAAYGICSFPTCVLIDRQGNVIKQFHPSNTNDVDELEKMLMAKKLDR